MKRLTNCMTTAAAVLMVTAGVASAQTVLRAEVPFAFHVGSKVMEQGKIRVRLNGGNSRSVVVTNFDASRSYTVLPKATGDAPAKWIAGGRARMSFDCSTGTCILSQIWSGEGYAYQLYGPKTRAGETLLTEIVMKPDKGD